GAAAGERSFAQLLTSSGIASIHFGTTTTQAQFARFARGFPSGNAKPTALAEQLKSALAGDTSIKINEIRYVAEDSSVAGIKVAAQLTARVLGAQGDKFKDFLDDPNKLLQMIFAAESNRGPGGPGGGGPGGGSGAPGGGGGSGAPGTLWDTGAGGGGATPSGVGAGSGRGGGGAAGSGPVAVSAPSGAPASGGTGGRTGGGGAAGSGPVAVSAPPGAAASGGTGGRTGGGGAAGSGPVAVSAPSGAPA